MGIEWNWICSVNDTVGANLAITVKIISDPPILAFMYL